MALPISEWLPSLDDETLAYFYGMLKENLAQVEAEMAVRSARPARSENEHPIGPFTVMLCESCDTDREVDTYSAEGVATFRVCGHRQGKYGEEIDFTPPEGGLYAGELPT